jgi:Outer membrane protein beta-barrel domain
LLRQRDATISGTVPASVKERQGMRMTKAAAIIALAAFGGLGSAGQALAQQTGVYASGFYGNSDRQAEQAPFDTLIANVSDSLDFVPQQTTANFDTKDNGYGLTVGYRFTPHLAVEGGYMDLGGASYRNNSLGAVRQRPSDVFAVQQNLDLSVSGIAASALLILPFSYRWEVYARGGALFSSNRFDYFLTDGQLIDRVRESKSSIDLLVGAGLSFNFAEVYGLRAEFVRVFDAGKEQFGLPAGDVDLAQIAVTVAF